MLNKETVIVYGNCHTETLTDMLLACPRLTEQYEIKRICPVHTIKTKDYFDEPVFHECDVFIHQSIRLQNRYGEEFASEKVIRKLKPGCRIIAIPNLYHLPKCFFPQYSEEPELKRNGETVFFRDSVIDAGRRARLSEREIVAEYLRDDLYSEQEILDSFAAFIEKVRQREREWDVKIADFIVENYRQHQLFFDPNHPTNYLLRFVADRVAEILLDEAGKQKQYEFDMSRVRTMDCYEMPVCNAVRKALRLEGDYDDVYRKSVDGRKLSRGEMRVEEYVREYCAMEWTNPTLGFMRRARSFSAWFAIKLKNKIAR